MTAWNATRWRFVGAYDLAVERQILRRVLNAMTTPDLIAYQDEETQVRRRGYGLTNDDVEWRAPLVDFILSTRTDHEGNPS